MRGRGGMAVYIDARSNSTGQSAAHFRPARKRKQVATEALANKMARISIFVMLVSITYMN